MSQIFHNFEQDKNRLICESLSFDMLHHFFWNVPVMRYMQQLWTDNGRSFFTIEFNLRQSRQPLIVKMDSVNDIGVHELGNNFQRRGSSFRLPLAPSADVSSFTLVFTEFSSEIADTVRFNKQVQVSYQRQIIESNGAIKIKADQFRITYHDFDSIAPLNFDPLKTTNELRLQVFL